MRAAVGRGSTAGIIIADSRLCDEVRERDWQAPFTREWKRVWFRRIDGYGPEDRFSTLVVFARRDVFLEARDEWTEEEAWGDGCPAAKETR